MQGDDCKLLERIAAGEEDTMRALYARYADRLYRFALSRLQDTDAAGDAVQETLIAAWKGAGSYRGASQVSTWLFGICRNKVGDVLRRREPPAEPLWVAETLATPEDSGFRAEFWECFGRLSDEHQELILLSFHYGFSQEEVAQILGVPVGTVKSRTFYARRRLQAFLQGDE